MNNPSDPSVDATSGKTSRQKRPGEVDSVGPPRGKPAMDKSVPSAFDSGAVKKPKRKDRQRRKHFRRIVISLVAAVSVIGVMQWVAPSTDYQVANMGSLLVGFLATLVILFQAHQLARLSGYRFRVPAVAAAVLLGSVVLLEFDGFSGEMLPQFKWRFSERQHELAELNGGQAARPASQPTAEDEVFEPTIGLQGTAANVQSVGFLGNQRDGIAPKREFAVPSKTKPPEILWEQGIGEGWASFAVADGRAVTLEQRDDLDCVTCYRLTDGELLWMQSQVRRHTQTPGGDGPRSTPTIEGGRVYAQSATGLVWCIDLHSGETIWTADLLERAGWNQEESEEAITWGRSGSPLLVDGLCVVPFGGPESQQQEGRSLIALDAETGEERWTAGEDQISYASPMLMTLAEKRQIVVVNEKTITGHEIDDGEVLWELAWPGQSNAGANCASVVPAGKDRFLIGKGYQGGSSLVEVRQDEQGGYEAEEIWHTNRFFKTKFTHACVKDGVGYAISNGTLEAVDIEDRKRFWRQPRSARVGQGQLLLAEDILVAQAEEGEIVFIKVTPEEYHELIRIPALDSKTWNIPTLAGRYLLVRNDRQAICMLLPERTGS